jgi:LTXXQ motif family protein
MSWIAPYGGQLLLVMVAGAMLSSWGAQARHWRHHGSDWDRARAEGELPGGENGSFQGGNKFSSLQRRERDLGSVRPLENAGRRPETISFGSAVSQLIEGCQRQVTEFKKLPFDSVAQTIQPNDDQRDALEAVRKAVNDAADELATVCPRTLQGSLGEKLVLLSHSLDAVGNSLKSVRPAFVAFYASLDDEQKARLVIKIVSSSLASNAGAVTRIAVNGQSSSMDLMLDPTCNQWAGTLRNFPIRQIGADLALSDEQHAGLYEFAAELHRTAGAVTMSCPAEERFSPVGRLDRQQKTVGAFRQGIDEVRQVFLAFEKQLNEDQRKRLDKIVAGGNSAR